MKRKTTRKPKTTRVPRTRAGGEWTEAAFMGFIRSNLRRMSQRWPPLVRLALLRQRRKSQSANKRLKWEFQCEHCQGWFKRDDVAVDHIVECGALKTLDDLPRFVGRLLCETDKLRVLCDGCHTLRHGKTTESPAVEQSPAKKSRKARTTNYESDSDYDLTAFDM